MDLLASGSHSGATFSLTSISGSYVNLVVILDAVDLSANVNLAVRFNQDTNANRHRTQVISLNDGNTFNGTYSEISAPFNGSNTTNQIYFQIPNYASTSSWKFGIADSYGVSYTSSSEWWYRRNTAAYNQSSAITSLDFIEPAGGSFACSYKLYGVK
jgi:hypothetical protein